MRPRVVRRAVPVGTRLSSQRRKTPLDIDINTLPCENVCEVGTSNQGNDHQEAETAQGAPPQPVTIDVDSIDDDVILCSPRAFAEAMNKSRRNRVRSNVVDLELESHARQRNKRRTATSQPIINCESYINLESDGNTMNGNGQNLCQSPSVPQEPTFNCPICMGRLVEETSTKCGHIFCKACIKQSIATQSKCPTCRKRVTVRDTFRIYLPAMSSN